MLIFVYLTRVCLCVCVCVCIIGPHSSDVCGAVLRRVGTEGEAVCVR